MTTLRANRTARLVALAALLLTLAVSSMRLRADTGSCGGQTVTLPFTDVMGNPFFCQIAAAYFSGLTNGTTATTYSPAAPVPREQMAAFVSRTLDQSLRRGSRRAALQQSWTLRRASNLGLTPVGETPTSVASDGADLWVANRSSGTVSRVRASDGRLLETWTGAAGATGVLVGMGKVFVTGYATNRLYQIDPSQPAGPVTTLTSNLGDFPIGIADDGQRFWTANFEFASYTGSVSIVAFNPLQVITVPGFGGLEGILYDGAHIWVTDLADNTLKKLDANGAVLQSIFVSGITGFPAFDGTNIWVPVSSDTAKVTVVRVKDAAGNPLPSAFVLATLTGNGLNDPVSAAFDGERILVTNPFGNSVSLWKATDLTPIGTASTGANTRPFGACSDGLNFWVTLRETGRLARF